MSLNKHQCQRRYSTALDTLKQFFFFTLVRMIVQFLPQTDCFLCEFFSHMSEVRCKDIKALACIMNRITHGYRPTRLCLIVTDALKFCAPRPE